MKKQRIRSSPAPDTNNTYRKRSLRNDFIGQTDTSVDNVINYDVDDSNTLRYERKAKESKFDGLLYVVVGITILAIFLAIIGYALKKGALRRSSRR
uniref:Triple QxxK/R motif-containing protein n=1 Tax=Parastrongyloides trichosuri TaxID=131310 RepID=A0A0N4ZQ58_PARTI